MSGSAPPPPPPAPAAVTQRSSLRRSVSPIALLSGGLLIAGIVGLWFWFGRSNGTAEYDAVDSRPALPHRIARPPEPAMPATPVVSTPFIPHNFQMPTTPSVISTANAAPVNTGPMVTHYSSSAHASSVRNEPTGGSSEAKRRSVNYKQGTVDIEEATVITDLGRTLKPTTRIGCTLTQAVDGTHAGPLTCVVTRDVLAWDNATVLLPKDTPVVGTYQPLTQGQGRMMAIAATAWRSDGLAVPLGGAPMTDPLGRLGMDGYVDSRFWERIGNAILTDAALSAIKLPEAALRSQSRGIQFNSSDTESVVNQVLQSTVNLPPTFRKNQGEEISILLVSPIHLGALRYEVVR